MSYKALPALIGLVFIVSVGSSTAQDAGKKVISTPNAPEAIGPYSQAIRVGNAVYSRTDRDRSENQTSDGECVDRGSDAAGA